jgi:hypothetical protein
MPARRDISRSSARSLQCMAPISRCDDMWMPCGRTRNLPPLELGEDLELQTLIAAREANDVISLARLAAMAGYLNDRQPLQDDRHWETCLISGSLMMRDLLAALDATELNGFIKDRVRLIHPLCFLRHPELYDPDGVKALEHRGEGEYQDEEYAFTQIFGHTAQGRCVIEDEKSRAFVQSLTRTLHGVVAREAKKNDRALRAFWGKTGIGSQLQFPSLDGERKKLYRSSLYGYPI